MRVHSWDSHSVMAFEKQKVIFHAEGPAGYRSRIHKVG